MKLRWSNGTSLAHEFSSGTKADFWKNLQDAYAAFCVENHSTTSMCYAELHVNCGDRWTDIIIDRMINPATVHDSRGAHQVCGGYAHVVAGDADRWQPCAGQHGADRVLYVNVLMPNNPVADELWRGAIAANRAANGLTGLIADITEKIP